MQRAGPPHSDTNQVVADVVFRNVTVSKSVFGARLKTWMVMWSSDRSFNLGPDGE